MSEKENTQEVKPVFEQTEDDLDSFLQNFEEASGEGMPSPEKMADLARKAPEASVTGNERIQVLSHSLLMKKGKEGVTGKGVTVSLKNIAGADIGKVVFECVFFDAKGNVVDTIEQTAADFEAGQARSLRIETPRAEAIDIKSYDVKIIKMIMTPVPAATGDDRITILRHNFQDVGNLDVGITQIKSGIELALRNVSKDTVSTIVFEVELFDSDGNDMGTVRHKEFEIKPNNSRAILLAADTAKEDKVKSYNIRVIKTITTDVEKVQLRRNEFKKLGNGSEEVSGLIKNISDLKTDAVLVVTYLDAKEEKIGVKALHIKDIEPNTVRKFSLMYTPPEGETVKTRNFDIGEMTEGKITDAIEAEGVESH